ncbi:MAG: Rieske (2Fe-2S) protein [Pirellulales bacterium]
MSRRIAIAKTTEIPLGEGRAFPTDKGMIAIFNENGSFFAIDDFCPHQGASLACGHLEDGAVACPWHAWRFSIRDGAWLDNPKIKVDSYPLEVDGETLWIVLPDE